MNYLLKGLSPHETGTHKFTFLAALRCQEHGLTPEQAEDIIEAEENNMPRNFKHGEVEAAVSSAYGSEGGKSLRLQWPSVNKTRRQNIMRAAAHVTVAALQQCSPEPVDPQTEQILRMLFPDPSTLICIGRERYNARTQEHPLFVSEVPLVRAASFIVPSPMTKQFGKAKGGRRSSRCLDNTGPRRHIVVECDDSAISKDGQAAILNYLAQFAPLVMVVDSAGKSLHGWFACENAPEEHVKAFFAEAVSLGADDSMWTRCQFVRMPNGLRRTWGEETRPAEKQRVIYLNTANRGTPGAPLLLS